MFGFFRQPRAARPSQSAQRFTPRLEQLERRDVPTLSAQVLNGVLTIRPTAPNDTTADTVTITQTSNFSYQVRGAGKANATLGYLPVKGVTSIWVDLGGGANTFSLRADAGVNVPGVLTGGGVAGYVYVKAGTGNDTFTITDNTIVYGRTTIQAGNGNNTVTLGVAGVVRNVSLLGGLTVVAGTGNDSVTTASQSTARVDGLVLNLGAGADTVSFTSSIVNGIQIDLGAGNDKVTLNKVTVNKGAVNVLGGADNDAFLIALSNFNDTRSPAVFNGGTNTADGDALDLNNGNVFLGGVSAPGWEAIF